MQADTQAITARAFVPDIITKELSLIRTGDHRKVRLSTNFLPLMGFETGTRHSVEVLGRFEGIRVAFDTAGPQKVYQRKYKARRNNPFESIIEIGSQSVLNDALPGYTERLHFTMRPGEIIIRPLENRTFSIRRQLKAADNPFAAFVAMTSGVDVKCLQDTGYTIDSVLEYRPRETRDSNDLTETGAITVLANAKPRLLLNEDISKVDWDNVKTLMKSGPQIAVLHVSLQCDEFSNVKAKSLKEKSLDDLSTSHDLVYDALRMIETVRPGCVLVENVVGFKNSSEGQLLVTKLRKWGYNVTEATMSAMVFDGKTRRQRYYLVASVFPDFQMPEMKEERTNPIWNDIEQHLTQCRDISHTKSLQDGLVTGRARLITPDSLYSPTLLKSQSRQAKDSVYIAMPDGRYLFPSLELQRHLNGIPVDFDLNCVSEGIGSEIIGQSIEWPMHHAICKSLHDHIGMNVGKHTVAVITKQSNAVSCLMPVRQPTVQKQLGLF